jgi:hypothetical protein
MTIDKIEAVLLLANVKIALRHRFAFDTGTILRLENFAIINVFDDGRYYVQGNNVDELRAALNDLEPPWNPDEWAGEMPRQAPPPMIPAPVPTRRFDL